MVEEAIDATESPSDVGPYQILRRLGRGGMADVYVGRHRLIGRTAAIKVLHDKHASDPTMRARFLNEARAVASIQHPNVVVLYEIGQAEDGDVYLAMELLEGETLSERLRRDGRLPASEAVRVAEAVGQALAAAHARQVIHRDLKPSNVMLVPSSDGHERIKVLDFGIAKVFESPDTLSGELTRTGAVVGTPTYMSPEQCRGHGEVDLRTDVYSLGVVLYRMVTGRPPFKSKGAGEIIGMHLYVQPRPPRFFEPSVPRSLERFILRCMCKDPERRFANMDEFLEALDEVRDAIDNDTDGDLADDGSIDIDLDVSGDGSSSESEPSRVAEINLSDVSATADSVRPRRRVWLVVLGMILSASVGVAAAWLSRGEVRSASDDRATTTGEPDERTEARPPVRSGGLAAQPARPPDEPRRHVPIVRPLESPPAPETGQAGEAETTPPVAARGDDGEAVPATKDDQTERTSERRPAEDEPAIERRRARDRPDQARSAAERRRARAAAAARERREARRARRRAASNQRDADSSAETGPEDEPAKNDDSTRPSSRSRDRHDFEKPVF